MAKTGMDLIKAERIRQVQEEGWTREHDAGQNWEEIGKAGAAYALSAGAYRDIAVALWPWQAHYWKPKNPLRDLVRAGALIAAAIDRYLEDELAS